MKHAFLGLGANVGDREGNLRAALARLETAPGVNLRGCSRVYQTEPVGVTEQPEFLNMVVEVEISDGMTARDLLLLVKRIETEVGRRQRERWGPREIDIDILLFDNEQVMEDDFEVPHPRMWERAFVLAPLAELAPDLKTPGGETVAEAAARLSIEQKVYASIQL